MREVKYRAWWGKTMCEVTCIDFAHNECFLKYQQQTTNDCIEKIVPLNEVKMMQWTGLKDKNETDIYEGDIIKSEYIFEDSIYGDVGLVVFKNYKWIVEIPSAGDDELLDYENHNIGIIGNIYENPELLEGEE